MLAILEKADAESLGSPPHFQVNIEIQLNAARVSILSFRFLYLWYICMSFKCSADKTKMALFSWLEQSHNTNALE